VVWCGSPNFKRDYNRSLNLAQFAPVLTVDGVTYLSLNPGIGEPDVAALEAMPNVFHIGPQFRDFADTAAVIALLDLVITSDTSVAHLAGAMGKSVWVMLSPGCDWRWMRVRADSPWYPSARLFRASTPGDWADVAEQLRRELTVLVGEG
jgi:hypothetical protein